MLKLKNETKAVLLKGKYKINKHGFERNKKKSTYTLWAITSIDTPSTSPKFLLN